MNPDWQPGAVPLLNAAQRDFLRVLAAVVARRDTTVAPASWEPILQLAIKHQVDAFVYSGVATWAAPRRPPPAVLDHWQRAFVGAVARYERGVPQIGELLDALHRDRVPVIAVKGARLAELIYDDGACRPMSDIDLLVKVADIARADQTLRKLGYACDDLAPRLTGARHNHYHKTDTPRSVELHWSLWPTTTLEETAAAHERVWREARTTTLLGVPVAALAPACEIIHLAEHILRHNWAMPLRSCLDLALLLRHYETTVTAAQLHREANAWHIPFSAPFVMSVAVEICGYAPTTALEPLLRQTVQHQAARQAAQAAIVQLSDDSIRLTPALAAAQCMPPLRRLGLAVQRIVITPAEIRRFHPQAVRRFGLLGGYAQRLAKLLRRHGAILAQKRKDLESVMTDCATANFATRRQLGGWLATRDQALQSSAPAEIIQS